MKLMLTIAGIVLMLLGCVWIAQGIGLLPGSFMTGQIQWAVFGAILGVLGVVLVVWARRRPAD